MRTPIKLKTKPDCDFHAGTPGWTSASGPVVISCGCYAWGETEQRGEWITLCGQHYHIKKCQIRMRIWSFKPGITIVSVAIQAQFRTPKVNTVVIDNLLSICFLPCCIVFVHPNPQVALVPLSVSYDSAIELGSYISEQKGEAKVKESFFGFIQGTISAFRRTYGHVWVRIQTKKLERASTLPSSSSSTCVFHVAQRHSVDFLNTRKLDWLPGSKSSFISLGFSSRHWLQVSFSPSINLCDSVEMIAREGRLDSGVQGEDACRGSINVGEAAEPSPMTMTDFDHLKPYSQLWRRQLVEVCRVRQ